MAKIDFHRNERPTVGIELELGLLDAQTLALSSAYGLLNARLTAEERAVAPVPPADGLPLDTLELPPGFAIEVYSAQVPGARSLTRS